MEQQSDKGDVNLVDVEFFNGRQEDGSDRGSDSDPRVMGCGFGRCRPRFLQIFATPFAFMIAMLAYCLLEGAIVNGEPRTYLHNYSSCIP